MFLTTYGVSRQPGYFQRCTVTGQEVETQAATQETLNYTEGKKHFTIRVVKQKKILRDIKKKKKKKVT